MPTDRLSNVLLAAALMMAWMACAQSSAFAGGLSLSSVPAEATSDAMFQRLDVDHDGHVSRAEAALQPDFLAAFDQADTVRAGTLDREGFRRAQALYASAQLAVFVDDSQITARIKAALLRPGAAPLSRVQVSTLDGVVRLSGEVASAGQAQRALLIAAATAGVKSVQNDLTFKS